MRNPVAKALRTPRYKIQIKKSKKLYDRTVKYNEQN